MSAANTSETAGSGMLNNRRAWACVSESPGISLNSAATRRSRDSRDVAAATGASLDLGRDDGKSPDEPALFDPVLEGTSTNGTTHPHYHVSGSAGIHGIGPIIGCM